MTEPLPFHFSLSSLSITMQSNVPNTVTVVVLQLLSCVQLFATPWTAAHQGPLSSIIFCSLLKFISTELVMLSNHFILCHPLLLLPSIFPSIRVFSNELVLHIRQPKCWSFYFSISSSNKYSGLISCSLIFLSKRVKGLSGEFSSPSTVLLEKNYCMIQQSHSWVYIQKK